MNIPSHSPVIPSTRESYTVAYGRQKVNLSHLFGELSPEYAPNFGITIDVSNVANYYQVSDPALTRMYATPSSALLESVKEVISGLVGRKNNPLRTDELPQLHFKLTRIVDGTWSVSMSSRSNQTVWGGSTLSLLAGVLGPSEVKATLLPFLSVEVTPLHIGSQLAGLFEKTVHEFRFSFTPSEGVSFQSTDASDYFPKAVSLEEGTVVFNGTSAPLDIIYDLHGTTNIKKSLSNNTDRIEAYGFCSYERLDELKARLLADAKHIACIKIDEHKKTIEKLEAFVVRTNRAMLCEGDE
jgi:hypothetical protein